MSHMGSGNNLMQPSGQCFGCKYWAQAHRDMFIGVSGHCTLSYCKKNSIHTRKRGKHK